MTTQPQLLTDADLVVGNRFECLQDIFRGQYGMSFSKGCKYTCEARGTLMSNEGLNHVLSAAVLNHHFKLIQTVQNENVIEFQNKVIDISTKEVSDLTNQLLLLQQENAILISKLQAQGKHPSFHEAIWQPALSLFHLTP